MKDITWLPSKVKYSVFPIISQHSIFLMQHISKGIKENYYVTEVSNIQSVPKKKDLIFSNEKHYFHNHK